MISRKQLTGALGALVIALSTFGTPADSALAHARYVSHKPTMGAAHDGAPTTLKVTFSQELRLASMVKVSDADGAQVDLGDGRVDQDDPARKAMLVSLPQLTSGLYTVEYIAVSAEDDHSEYGTFAVGVGVDAPPLEPAASAPSAGSATAAATTASEAVAPTIGRADCPAKTGAMQQ